jgi:hypothetical protein
MEAMESVDIIWYSLCTFLVFAVYHPDTLVLICDVNIGIYPRLKKFFKSMFPLLFTVKENLNVMKSW